MQGALDCRRSLGKTGMLTKEACICTCVCGNGDHEAAYSSKYDTTRCNTPHAPCSNA